MLTPADSAMLRGSGRGRGRGVRKEFDSYRGLPDDGDRRHFASFGESDRLSSYRLALDERDETGETESAGRTTERVDRADRGTVEVVTRADRLSPSRSRNTAHDIPGLEYFHADYRRADSPPSRSRKTAQDIPGSDYHCPDYRRVKSPPSYPRHTDRTLTDLDMESIWNPSTHRNPILRNSPMRRDVSGERNRPPTTAKKSSPAVKLEKYSGVTDLKTYLVKFDYMANYYGWTSDDRVFHLTTSLDGAAGQLLWELSQSPTEAEVRRLLNSRFGHSDQQERFRAELRTRCRRPGESIPALYTDIRRLLSLSYPGQSGDINDTIGKDCFLDALGDSALRIRVLDQSPKTLEDALSVVCRMQAYSIGYPSSQTEGEHHQPVRQVAAETVQKRNEVSMLTAPPVQPMMDARWKAEVEQTIANLRRELQQARADTAAVTSQSPIAQFGPPTTPSWMQSKPAPSTFVGHPNIPHQPATWQSSSSAPTSSTSDQLPSHVARDASRRGGYGRPHGRTADRRC